ncbi:MAG: hypothetical protein ABJ327_02090 [Litoreibacter sp.]
MRAILLILLLTTACGRPLSPAEETFAKAFHGPALDTNPVKVTRQPLIQFYRSTVPIPPRLTCAQKLFPPSTQTTWTGSPSATVLFNTIHTNPDAYSRDYLPAYPEVANIIGAMFLAHELVHIWQWQNRGLTGYHPFKAAAEHQASPDPYLFDLATQSDFLDFGYEQQGAIASEYTCCAALAPNAPRTKRLHDLLSKYFPIQNLTATLPQVDFPLPWDGADRELLCS